MGPNTTHPDGPNPDPGTPPDGPARSSTVPAAGDGDGPRKVTFGKDAAGFLTELRRLTERHGALLIYDEVMTGFRLAFGGAQQLYGQRPDVTVLGKIVGGGLPVGAYGGRADVMKCVSPAGPVYQAGTLSGNPLAMAAGIATLCELKERPPHTPNRQPSPRMRRRR